MVNTTMEDSGTFQLNFDWFRRQYIIPDADLWTFSAGRNFTI